MAVGSAPGAALFFSTYELSKKFLMPIAIKNNYSQPLVHMICASIGEFVSAIQLLVFDCLVGLIICRWRV